MSHLFGALDRLSIAFFIEPTLHYLCSMQKVRLHDLGEKDYNEVWLLQKKIFQEAIDEKLNNKKPVQHLIVCEHPHVYTLGKNAQSSNLLLSEEELKSKSISVYEIERGGDITYHGPGQLVVYPIFDLEQLGLGVKKFVYLIEECIIQTLGDFGIMAERIEGRIGIWIDKDGMKERKIAAIGIKCSRHISMHGLALNVNTDMQLFNHIIPCGISDKAVSSMELELSRKIEMTDVKELMLKKISSTFGIHLDSV